MTERERLMAQAKSREFEYPIAPCLIFAGHNFRGF